MVFNMPGAAQWVDFCRALGLDHWLTDEKYDSPKGRYDHMPELTQGVDEALAAKSRDEWGKIFDAAGLIWGPVLGLHEVPGDPQAQAINLFPTINDATHGEYKTVGIPMRFSKTAVGPARAAPALGQHSKAILEEFDFSPEAIEALAQQGVTQAHD
ncbi:MAG: crotonobetainyl-CoA:carnitine CoA-transferase CaiB-like acyl-CoA transferase [Candidatus Azotimanducaceae bacterium]